MTHYRRVLVPLAALAALMLLTARDRRAEAYVEAPHSMGQIVSLSSNVVLMRVEKVDKAANRIVYRKVRDLKGVHKQDEIRHNIGTAGFHAREWQTIMRWAEVGKTAVFFHNGSQSETCIGMYWYQAYGNANDVNGWWGMTHGEPFLLRSFAGKIDKLVAAVTDLAAGKEVVVPCMVDGNKDDLHMARAKIQRMKASLKLDYNPKRDFAGWGGEDFRRVLGMPGFTHLSTLGRIDPDAQSISVIDFNRDGKMDLCLAGASRVLLLQNAGESLSEASLPGVQGARAVVWADYNGDGLPDLLLATPAGPRLFTNKGKGVFQDDSHLLREPGYNLTCAAWIDQDGDGRPDILLGNGFYGLRLYRNQGKPARPEALGMGPWRYIGPFDNAGKRGFATAYGPEKEIDYRKTYPGKGETAAWKEGRFTDGKVNNLALFRTNTDAVVYLHRAITCPRPMKLPVSLGSDDGIIVWLNGKRLLANNVDRACAADQERLTLDLKAGQNDLLLKVCQGGGDWAFYFKALADVPKALTWRFEDVSDEVGLGENGIGSDDKGDTLTVCDVDGDGRQDFLYGSAKAPILALNTRKGFVAVKDSGISYRTGQVGPVFADYDGDGRPDLFVPQPGGCKLFRNEGKGRFTDVTRASGLSRFTGHATSAAWGDVDNDGRLDLVVGCLRGPNRFFRNKGDGTFEDASAVLGLDQKVFNTQAVALVDLNNDGALDVVFCNEGQDSCVLLGNPELPRRHTPVTLQVAGKEGVLGSHVRVLDRYGKLRGVHQVSGGDGRGGQAWPAARFALAKGTYTVEVVFSTGRKRTQTLTVAAAPVRGVVD